MPLASSARMRQDALGAVSSETDAARPIVLSGFVMRFLVTACLSLSRHPRAVQEKNKTHWMLAPTRRLRTQHMEAALQCLELEQVCPAGADEDGGEDLFVTHYFRLVEKHSKAALERLEELRLRLQQVRRHRDVWYVLSEYERLVYKIYKVDAPAAVEKWGLDGCVAVATHDYYLKLCADGARKPRALGHPTGGVFLDEADEATLMSTLAAASGQARPSLRPFLRD